MVRPDCDNHPKCFVRPSRSISVGRPRLLYIGLVMRRPPPLHNVFQELSVDRNEGNERDGTGLPLM